jgi:PKD repeat protein
VTVAAANQSPVAAFTTSTTNLVASFDSSASADPDGTIAARVWDFGDGTTSTATSPSRTYAAAGTYTVVLTVTDNQGATGTSSQAVTVTAASSVLAADTFSRTVVNGLGTAETGGAWTLSGAATNFAVNGGTATLRMPTTSLGITGYLNSVSGTSTDTRVTAGPDKVTTGNGAYIWVVGRRSAGGEYRGRVRLLSNGGIAIQVSRYVSGTETVIGTETVVSGLTYAAGTPLRIRLQVDGTGTTTLRLKVWRADGTEPATWQKTGTDSTAGIQTAGSVGLATYLSGSSTNAPITISFDDYSVTAL